MKRTIIASAAAVGVGALLWASPLAATGENSPHSGPGAHPHHKVNASGCHDIQAPPMEPGSRGLHRAALNDDDGHDKMHHGTCAGHGHGAG